MVLGAAIRMPFCHQPARNEYTSRFDAIVGGKYLSISEYLLGSTELIALRAGFLIVRNLTDVNLPLRAKRSDPPDPDCFVAGAPRNNKSPPVYALPLPILFSEVSALWGL